MARRTWKRMREEGAKAAHQPRPDHDNPWQEEPAVALSRLRDLPSTPHDPGDADRAERYNEWAERIKAKRRRLAQDLDGSPTPSHWSTDALFEESRRVEAEELHTARRSNPWRVQELLAVLDLREGATAAEVGTAYRRLAKVHHPDHFVEADPDTQEYHADKMREIIRAYRTLLELQREGAF